MSIKPVEITICLGSSCFARGNKKAVCIIQKYLKENKLEESVNFKGNHCFDKCNKGPILKIDDQIYEGVQEDSIVEILERELKKKW